MPYWAPFAAIPRISMAPRFAEMKAIPVTHAGNDLPASRKSSLVAIARLANTPIATTKVK